jgi:ATPase subunit of ABC transporter with duplicated ATPase domains
VKPRCTLVQRAEDGVSPPRSAGYRPDILLLDEPTNNLDLASARKLSRALDGYRGAIIVASHDVPFLRTVGITRWLRLDRDTGLTPLDPL